MGGEGSFRCYRFTSALSENQSQSSDFAARIFRCAFPSGCVKNSTAMFSLQRLLGKEDMFFELLEASAREAHNSVQSLVKLSKAIDRPVELEEFARARRKDKEITAQIRNALYTTFATALEREDIEALCNALYRIPKTVEKFSERVLLAPQHVRDVDFSQQINLLDQATKCVVQMVKSLRSGVNLDETKTLNDQLQQ